MTENEPQRVIKYRLVVIRHADVVAENIAASSGIRIFRFFALAS